jgi:hypothetical protein
MVVAVVMPPTLRDPRGVHRGRHPPGPRRIAPPALPIPVGRRRPLGGDTLRCYRLSSMAAVDADATADVSKVRRRGSTTGEVEGTALTWGWPLPGAIGAGVDFVDAVDGKSRKRLRPQTPSIATTADPEDPRGSATTVRTIGSASSRRWSRTQCRTGALLVQLLLLLH